MNPFSTKFWTPGTIPFLFSEHGDNIDSLLGKTEQHPVSQIVGPHGSGKSTLLLNLLKRYKKRGNNVRYLSFNAQNRSVPDDLTFPPHQVLCVDGFEQLHILHRTRLLFRSKHLILTAHHPVWLVPVLFRTEPQFPIFIQIVRQMLPDPPEESVLRAVYEHSGGNFRNAFFGLYDQWEKQGCV